MGYSPDYFGSVVEHWLDSGWLFPNGRLIEFGAQEFYCDPAEARCYAEQFLRRRGKSAADIAAVLGASGAPSVAAIHRAIGIEYTSIDVDGAHGSAFFDLNSFAPPLEWRASFDLVNNEGTIEHLVNPINGFQVAHELLKVDGVAVHSIPITGHHDHGIIYPTIKFYSRLLDENHYELLQADITIDKSDLDFRIPRFSLRDKNGHMLDPKAMTLTDAWLRLAYRKTAPAEFRVPFDHLMVDEPNRLGEGLSANFSVYSRHRLSASAKRDPIGDEFERQVELRRRPHRIAAALLASALVALNGYALIVKSTGLWAFAAGFIAASAPMLVARTRLEAARTVTGAVIRYGSRLLWLMAALLFVLGCLIQPL